jgi:hypothetical protein
MAIGKINGPMLQPNLERQGVNIAIDGNLTYWDVNNRYVGINTTTPNYPLDVTGNAHLGNIYIRGNVISTDSGYKLNLGNIANITISGGSANTIMYTDGFGNISFGNISTVISLEGFSGNGIPLGTPTQGSITSAVVLQSTYTLSDSIALINQNLGNVTANVVTLTAAKYSNANAASYLTVYGGNISANVITANIFSGNITGNVTGNITGTTAAFANISGNVITSTQTYITTLGTLTNLAVAGNTTSANIVATSQFYGNLLGNVSGNIIGNITGTTAAFANISGNVLTASQPFITSLGNLTSLIVLGNITSGNVSANIFTGNVAGNITGNIVGNVLTPAQPYITSVGTLTSLVVSGNTTSGNVTTTSSFYGNILVDTIGSYKTNVVVFTNQTAVKLPTGDNSTRPPGIAGYFRYNSGIASIEYYNGTDWIPFNNQITNQRISPDGTHNSFTLNQTSSAEALIVSINGTMQQPGISYTVTGTTITFAEIPYITDVIDIRYIASAGTTTLDFAIVDTANVAVGTSNVIVDTFSPSVFRSAKYIVSSSSGTDASFLEAQLLQNNGIAVINTSANVNTGSNSITFYANVSGGLVNFVAKGTAASNQLRIQRTYFNV